MGRILETLKQAEAVRERTADQPPDLKVVGGIEPDEEVPFIEVGGPRSIVVASASVRASPIPSGKDTSPLFVPASEEALAPSLSEVPESIPTAVVFQPLPAEPPTLPPARERFTPELVAYHRPGHPVSEQYRTLLVSLTAHLPARPAHTLLFTAPKPGTRKALTLLNLGITAAKHGNRRVVVVDADVRAPVLAEQLGVPRVPGLQEVLSGTVSLRKALQETGQANLHVLTAGDPLACSPARLASEAMRAVLRHLCERYHLVLVHAPAWDGRPAVVALGCACDAVYLVAGQSEANTPEVQELLQVITEQGGKVRGCILTHNS
jgi:Mrp family chromosome partitioning ATPase